MMRMMKMAGMIVGYLEKVRRTPNLPQAEG
jgi:hypothetical protein